MAKTKTRVEVEDFDEPVEGGRGFRLPWYVIVLLILIGFFGGGVVWNRWMENMESYKYPPPGEVVYDRDEGSSNSGVHALVRGERAYEGQPAVLMLGGWDSVSPVLDYQPLFNTLTGGAKAIVVEKPGHGWSGQEYSRRTLDNIVGDIMYALEGVGEAGPFVIVAEGSAGLEAIRIAELYPFLVNGVVFVNAPPPAVYLYRTDRAMDYLKMFTYPVPRVTGVFRGVAAFKPELFSEGLPEVDVEAYAVMYCRNVMSPAMRMESHMLIQNARACLPGASGLKAPAVTFADSEVYQSNPELYRVWAEFNHSKDVRLCEPEPGLEDMPLLHRETADISRAVLNLLG